MRLRPDPGGPLARFLLLDTCTCYLKLHAERVRSASESPIVALVT